MSLTAPVLGTEAAHPVLQHDTACGTLGAPSSTHTFVGTGAAGIPGYILSPVML